MEKSKWSVDKSSEIYAIEEWGRGYFQINNKGNVCVTPYGENGTRVDLLELTKDLTERGIRTPILLRFTDIVNSRVNLINRCFEKAINEYNYRGRYRGVYPIKVNQQRHLVDEILKAGRQWQMGLECGSKPELLVALAMVKGSEALIVCNGFKDPEYIETALLSQKLDKKTIIVVDRFEELNLIIKASQKLKMKPTIGFRVKLSSKGAGKWVDSSGARSKFGLTASEVVAGFDLLREADLSDSLEMIHFHIGSQITSIQSIKSSLREGARLYSEIYQLGAKIRFVDVGGGLGVDYDGSGNSDSSVNYSEQEYANDVVSIIQDICDTKSVPHPEIISESGRALVAHQSMLVFDILGHNRVAQEDLDDSVDENEHNALKNLSELLQTVKEENLGECYNDLIKLKEDVHNLFNYGVFNLKQLARAEDLIWAATTKMEKIAHGHEDHEDLYENLKVDLSDTYFGNFSVFQSLPDSWAVKQVFPVMPIHRLKEEPTREATLVDLTCDSDGKIEQFIDLEGEKPAKTLSVHEIKPGKPYYVGVFLVGAYQEILGDLHNLFGDTDAVHIKLYESGYAIDHVVKGDTVGEILNYLEYSRSELTDSIRRMSERGIHNGSLTRQEARLLMKHYEDGLNGYTYLENLD